MKYYYVTAIDGKRFAFLLGPFTQHEEAIALIDVCLELAPLLDVKATFAQVGTASRDDSDFTGVLNGYIPNLGLTVNPKVPVLQSDAITQVLKKYDHN